VSAPYDQQIEQTLAKYREQRAGLGELQRRLSAISYSATSPRQVVSVTVGHQGEVTELKFPSGAYKRMAPAELAAVILSTIGEARSKALDEAASLLSPILPPGVVAKDLVAGKADLQAMMPLEPRTADSVMDRS
jgi:DNA-binding protein YbaB